MGNIAEGVAWTATCVAIGFCVQQTRSPWCLLAFFIPALCYTKTDKKKENKND